LTTPIEKPSRTWHNAIQIRVGVKLIIVLLCTIIEVANSTAIDHVAHTRLLLQIFIATLSSLTLIKVIYMDALTLPVTYPDNEFDAEEPKCTVD
jgi:hypothetical protein